MICVGESGCIVVDAFFDDPGPVRSAAMRENFDAIGSYPGLRTAPLVQLEAKEKLDRLFAARNLPQIDWETSCGRHGAAAFQLTTAIDETWVHCDLPAEWTAICYLTPDAPTRSGTSFYSHETEGQFASEFHMLSLEVRGAERWTEYLAVPNRFNRLLLFESRLFHAASGFFGSDLESGRLTQVFFLSTHGAAT
jgi:hypothetical protein